MAALFVFTSCLCGPLNGLDVRGRFRWRACVNKERTRAPLMFVCAGTACECADVRVCAFLCVCVRL